MDKRDIKHLEDLFQQSNCKSIADIETIFRKRFDALAETLQRQVIPGHLLGLDKGSALLRILIPSQIYTILNLGIYQSFDRKDMQILNNALYTYNRLASNKVSPGLSATDHCIYFPNVIECFAGNDLSMIYQMFPFDAGLTSNGIKFLVVGSNLIISMLYKKEDWREESLRKAKDYSRQKNGIFDQAVVNYLISLAHNEGEKAGNYLREACNLYKRAKWLHDFKSPYLSVFGLFIHGLYNLGRHVLNPIIFEKVEIPMNSVFWTDFLSYQKANSFTQGQRFFEFENDLQILNFIYN